MGLKNLWIKTEHNNYLFDFHDHDTQKPINIGTNIDLITAAYHYSYAHAQHKKLTNKQVNPTPFFMLGFSRGGGVAARLKEHIKKEYQPTGYILVSPALSLSQIIQDLLHSIFYKTAPIFY